MKNVPLITCVIVSMLIAVVVPNAAMALPVEKAREAIADRLVAKQAPNGSWPKEADFTGSIVAGMVTAYEVMGKAEYKAAAELGGEFILNYAQGNFYGDEAYALARLAEITEDTAYADVVRDFYDTTDTYAYIAGFRATDVSNVVFYVAHHAVAAHKVGATDAGLWRLALIQSLSLVGDDVAYYPVMSLGVATWALAQTGLMDDTQIDPIGLVGEEYWYGVALSDLPDILASHYVPSKPEAGCFYHRFDHAAADWNFETDGYTEDAIFGVLGLMAAATEEKGFKEEILGTQTKLCWQVLYDGIVYEHITFGGESYYTYGGEMLQALHEPATLLPPE